MNEPQENKAKIHVRIAGRKPLDFDSSLFSESFFLFMSHLKMVSIGFTWVSHWPHEKKTEKHIEEKKVIILGRIIYVDVLGLWYLIFQQCSCGTP